jgi:DNA-binding protein H-NS
MARIKKSKISDKNDIDIIDDTLEIRKTNVENQVNSSHILLEKMYSSLEKIIDRQESFEKQTIDTINKQSNAIGEIQKEFSHINVPVEQGQDEFKDTSNNVDSNGSAWGKNVKDEFKKPVATGNKFIDSLGIPPEALVGIAQQLISSLLNKPQQNGNMGGIFQELMIRNFMEDMQYTKMIQKAQMQSLFKKDLITSEDMKQASKNSDILNDPLNDVIARMKSKPQ